MKKKVCSILIAGFVLCSAFSSPFKELSDNIAALDATKNDVVTESIKDGMDILPILWRQANYTKMESKTLIDYSLKFQNYNPIDNVYQLKQKMVYKFGIGLQCQEADMVVSQEGSEISVITRSLVVYSVDKDGNAKTSPSVMMKKSHTENSKNFLITFKNLAEKTTDEDYQLLSDECYSNLYVQFAMEKAPNKLQAKLWCKKHPLENKKIKWTLHEASVDESDKEGYAYKVLGLIYDISVFYYTNDDSFVNLKKGQDVEISGTVLKAIYTDDFSTYYRVKYVDVVE